MQHHEVNDTVFSEKEALRSSFKKKINLKKLQSLYAAIVKHGNFAFQNSSKLSIVVESSNNPIQICTLVLSQL